MKWHKPNNDLSFQLLGSIPKKVNAWLGFIAPDPTIQNYHDLSWSFNNDGGYIQVFGGHAIKWTGSVTDIKDIEASCECVDDIISHLDQFIALEKSVYDILEKLQIEIGEICRLLSRIAESDDNADLIEQLHSNKFNQFIVQRCINFFSKASEEDDAFDEIEND